MAMASSDREEVRNLLHHDAEEQQYDTELGPWTPAASARSRSYVSAPEARLTSRRAIFGAAMALAVMAAAAAATLTWSPRASEANAAMVSEKYDEGAATPYSDYRDSTSMSPYDSATAMVSQAALPCTQANGCININGEEYWEVVPQTCDFHNLDRDCSACGAPCPTAPPCPTVCDNTPPENQICYTWTTTTTVTTVTETTTMTTTVTETTKTETGTTTTMTTTTMTTTFTETTTTVTTTTVTTLPATTTQTTTTTTPCATALPGSECYTKIQYARTDDIVADPNKYPGLTQESTAEEFQEVIHNLYAPDVCGEPCGIPKLGDCRIWADPHLISFDGLKSDYFTPGEYWMVRSDSVHLQARLDDVPISHGLACLTEVAIGGPFMGDHVLIVTPYKTTWDGQEIVGGIPSKFTNDFASIEHNNQGEVIQKQFAAGKTLDVLHIYLPNNVHLQIIRWMGNGLNYLNAIIKMPSIPGQDGICGNFNGNGDDDDKQIMRARFGNYADVPQNEMLLEGTKMPIEPVDKPSLRTVDQTTLNAAYKECEKYRMPPEHSCLIDFCFAGGKAMIDGQ